MKLAIVCCLLLSVSMALVTRNVHGASHFRLLRRHRECACQRRDWRTYGPTFSTVYHGSCATYGSARLDITSDNMDRLITEELIAIVEITSDDSDRERMLRTLRNDSIPYWRSVFGNTTIVFVPKSFENRARRVLRQFTRNLQSN